MAEKLVALLKESSKRNFPSVPEEEIERMIREDLQDTERLQEKLKKEGKIKPVELTSYDAESVSKYLKEKYNFDITPEETNLLYEDLDKTYGVKTEKEKANVASGMIGASILFAEHLKEKLYNR